MTDVGKKFYGHPKNLIGKTSWFSLIQDKNKSRKILAHDLVQKEVRKSLVNNRVKKAGLGIMATFCRVNNLNVFYLVNDTESCAKFSLVNNLKKETIKRLPRN